jgi:hypothetical protein
VILNENSSLRFSIFFKGILIYLKKLTTPYISLYLFKFNFVFTFILYEVCQTRYSPFTLLLFTTLVKELSFGVPLGQIYLNQGQRPTDKKTK